MIITLTLVALASAVALVVYWVAVRLPLPLTPLPPRCPGLFDPLYRYIEAELDLVRLHIPVKLFVQASLLCAGVGYVIALPFENDLLTLVAMATLGAAPYHLLQSRVRQRNLAMEKATLPALIQLAKICEVRRHPFLMLTDAVPVIEEPLKSELQQALLETQTGLSLPDALRHMAERCNHNFYLHQLAELVAIHITDGGDLAGSLERLANRLRTMEELRAEEAAELFGYRWLTRLLYAGSLLPLLYWAATNSPSLQFFVHTPLGRILAVWAVVSGLVIVSLPYWMAIDD